MAESEHVKYVAVRAEHTIQPNTVDPTRLHHFVEVPENQIHAGDGCWTTFDERDGKPDFPEWIQPWPDAERMAKLEVLAAMVRDLSHPTTVTQSGDDVCSYCGKSVWEGRVETYTHKPDCEFHLLLQAAEEQP